MHSSLHRTNFIFTGRLLKEKNLPAADPRMHIWIQHQNRLQSTRDASLKSPNFNMHVCNIVLTASEKSPLSLFFREIPIVLKTKVIINSFLW